MELKQLRSESLKRGLFNMYIQKIIKIGNSPAIIIPPEFVKELNLKVGTEVVISLDKARKAIIITPKKN